jgi:hypothetical protein
MFWRCYENSAFLFVSLVKPYHITIKNYKELGMDVAFLGFPDSVMEQIKELMTEI